MVKFNIMSIKFVIFFVLSVFIISCGSTKTNICVKESDNIIIRWGEFSNSEQIFRGWELNSKREVFSYSAKNASETVRGNYIDEIEVEEYCNLLKETKQLFLKNNILNVPGDNLHFIEFEDLNNNVNLRAAWVPQHFNVGNKEFKKLFLKMINAIPEKSDLKNKLFSREKIE